MPKYFEKIPGERLFLSPRNPDDAETYAKWLNDPAMTVLAGGYTQIHSSDAARKHLEDDATRSNAHWYSIVLREGERLIGNINLGKINPESRNAELGIFIGEQADRGCGYGTEAVRLMLGYGFHTLNLHNIKLEVFADNAQGIACYEKVGFREFGRRREAEFHGGRYFDVVCMDILSSEFRP
ncbi:MAG: GNAT family N-acetyltransferase [Oscillospiraceae bacterium]|nr:GNAT family N-acetyltransferase [Oscillospiraceae bacterium]